MLLVALAFGPAPLDLPDEVADLCEAVAWFRDTELSYTVASTDNLDLWVKAGDGRWGTVWEGPVHEVDLTCIGHEGILHHATVHRATPRSPLPLKFFTALLQGLPQGLQQKHHLKPPSIVFCTCPRHLKTLKFLSTVRPVPLQGCRAAFLEMEPEAQELLRGIQKSGRHRTNEMLQEFLGQKFFPPEGAVATRSKDLLVTRCLTTSNKKLRMGESH